MSASPPSSGLVQTKCAACGEEFGCGANATCEGLAPDCWCAAFKVSERELEELQASYQGCLCRNCLTRLVEDKRSNVRDDFGLTPRYGN